MTSLTDIRIEGPLMSGVAGRCEAVLRSLPDWFGIESAIVHYVEQIDSLPTWTAFAGAEAVGFLSIKRHFEHAAEVYVMGLCQAYHRRGIGRQLLTRAETWLLDQKVEYLQVKTVAPQRPNAHYALTREFYLAMGFRPLEVFPTLWDEANPCLILVKKLNRRSPVHDRL